MARRISRTPALLSQAEQVEFLNILERYPDLAKDVEALVGRPLSEMTAQQKITALFDYQKLGEGASVLAAAGRSINEVRRLAGAIYDEEATADKLRQAELREQDLREENAQLRNAARREAS